MIKIITAELQKLLLTRSIGEIIMKLMICLAVMAGLVGGCSYVNKKLGMADDNIIEEAIEGHIQEATGLNLDLSPESAE